MQHSAHIPPGRDGLSNFVEAAPSALKYKPGFIVLDGDFVHGRILLKQPSTKLDSGAHPSIEDGVFVEHWLMVQDEVTEAQLKAS